MSELTQTTNEALRLALETAVETKEFVLEHAPDVVQQYVMFGAVSNWAGVAFGILSIPCLYFLFRRVEKEWRKPCDDQNDAICIFGTVVSVVWTACAVAIPIACFLPAIKATWFPKLYIFDALKGMVM